MEDKVKIEVEKDGWIFEEDEHQMRLVRYYGSKEKKLEEPKKIKTRKRKNV